MADEQKENAQVAVVESKKQSLQLSQSGGLVLNNLDDMYRFAKYVVASGLAPKDMDTPEKILIALEMGYELGIPPMQAIQSIAVINGRPTLWGDVLMGKVRDSGLMEDYSQEEIGTKYHEDYGYKITSLRKGYKKPIITTFTVADARTAKLWGKDGPWCKNPDRMLLNRARAFNLRDNFQDVLKGVITREEAYDMPKDAEWVEVTPISKTESVLNQIRGNETVNHTNGNPNGNSIGNLTLQPPPAPEAVQGTGVTAEVTASEQGKDATKRGAGRPPVAKTNPNANAEPKPVESPVSKPQDDLPRLPEDDGLFPSDMKV